MSTVKINPALAKQQNMTEVEIASFELISTRLETFLRRPEMYANPEEAVAIVEGFEYVLQSLLKFPMGRSHHKYFCHLQGCDCPKYDNQDLFGTGNRCVNSNCKWHGADKHKQAVIDEYKDSEEFSKYIDKVKHHANINGYNEAVKDFRNTHGIFTEDSI